MIFIQADAQEKHFTSNLNLNSNSKLHISKKFEYINYSDSDVSHFCENDNVSLSRSFKKRNIKIKKKKKS